MNMTPAETVTQTRAAETRIRSYVRETIVERFVDAAGSSDCAAFLKCENLQFTGSFKVRGALNRVLALSPAERQRGVVAASTGNHGAAVAFALSKTAGRGLVFVPKDAVETKVQAIARYGVEIREAGDDPIETEIIARQHAERKGLIYISPYNDPFVIAGQGTIGIEIARQLSPVDYLFASVGGGGLISGAAAYLKSVWPELQVIGCSPENSPVLMRSVAAGKVIDMETLATLSDGTAGGMEHDSLTFPLCCQLVDDFVAVSEDEIAACLRDFIATHHMLIEGAAAVAIAGYRKLAATLDGKRAAIVLCGANISPLQLKAIL